MVKEIVEIINPTGLHLRPAGNLYKKANEYKSKVEFVFQNNTYNAKSILSILGACVKCGSQIELICEGDDEIQALQDICDMIKKGLGE